MSCSKAVATTISFEEIIHGRDSTVRYTHDNYIYAVDFVMVVTALQRDQAGLSLRRVIAKNLLSIQMIERNTGGKGNGKTQLISLRDALQLIMLLPGETAKAVRLEMAQIMTRVLGGDESLVDLLRANAASDSPIAQMARASLAAEQMEKEVGNKREREDRLIEMELAERAMALKERQLAFEKRQKSVPFELANEAMTTINALRNLPHVDERTKLQTEDYIKNVLFNKLSVVGSSGAITDGTDVPLPSAPITISVVATEIGLKLTDAQLQIAGRIMAKSFRETYPNEKLNQHNQQVSLTRKP
jgi:hypothetical protein